MGIIGFILVVALLVFLMMAGIYPDFPNLRGSSTSDAPSRLCWGCAHGTGS